MMVVVFGLCLRESFEEEGNVGERKDFGKVRLLLLQHYNYY
jgi:hypothetical protein